jgi:hypothetical protein
MVGLDNVLGMQASVNTIVGDLDEAQKRAPALALMEDMLRERLNERAEKPTTVDDKLKTLSRLFRELSADLSDLIGVGTPPVSR